jgi:hypothetical protein
MSCRLQSRCVSKLGSYMKVVGQIQFLVGSPLSLPFGPLHHGNFLIRASKKAGLKSLRHVTSSHFWHSPLARNKSQISLQCTEGEGIIQGMNTGRRITEVHLRVGLTQAAALKWSSLKHDCRSFRTLTDTLENLVSNCFHLHVRREMQNVLLYNGINIM